MTYEGQFILKCDHCEDVIGTYEPLVIVVDGEARQTSRAAESELACMPGEHYHSACHEQREQAAG